MLLMNKNTVLSTGTERTQIEVIKYSINNDSMVFVVINYYIVYRIYPACVSCSVDEHLNDGSVAPESITAS